MKAIPVSLKHNSYRILIGQNILKSFGKSLKTFSLGGDAVIISNPAIVRLHGRALADGLKKSGFSVKVLTVPDGEKSKSAPVAFQLMERIARHDVLKKVFIVALGGGVIGDLAGFVAAVYKRGVSYIQVPTTFLAQIDSAIGGKTAVDLPVGKNLVGAFYQPRLVLSDINVLSTLNPRQIRNGLAEAVKYGIIEDKKLFEYIETHVKELAAGNPRVILHVVIRCSEIKTKIVAADEKETKGLRTVLNFGHTLGHAIEAAGGFSRYPHGEAVALGMRTAAYISQALGLLSSRDLGRIQALLTKIGLPRKIKRLRPVQILEMMKHDKKFKEGKNQFVLAERIGKVKVVEEIPFKEILKAVEEFQA